MHLRKLSLLPFIIFWLVGCSEPVDVKAESSIDDIALEYVQLALALGEHEPGYIDAYIGPKKLQADVIENTPSLEQIALEIDSLRNLLQRIDKVGDTTQRSIYLEKQLRAMATRVAMLQGEKFSFDEETRLLYDAVAPQHDNAYFESALAEIAAIIPGEGALHERVTAYKKQFQIPTDKLAGVIETVVAECRARTERWMTLPEGEGFTIEYVKDKSWSGYNWYKGDNFSLLQINTDLPTEIGSVVGLGCHEGYPGHHVYNLMLEQRMVKEKDWMEFVVQPLFVPQAFLMEGTANFGVNMAFPGDTRMEYERDHLFPLAGLNPEKAEPYFRFRQAMQKLSYARNHAAREYLDGRWEREQAINWLTEYGLSTVERAQKSLDFIDTYRGYVINYNLGQDMVRDYVERTSKNEAERWQVFLELLGSSNVPSQLIEGNFERIK